MDDMDDVEDIDEPTERVSTTYSPPSDKESRWFFDYEKLYWEIKAHLFGGWLEEDKRGNYIIKKPKSAKPFMNIEGIESTMALINAFVTKIGALTILSEDRILELCGDLHTKLSVLYYVNMDKYNLTPDKASVVIRMVMTSVEANLRKSLGGKSLMLIGETEKIVEQKVVPKKKFGVI